MAGVEPQPAAPAAGRFRLSARRLFLTYSQVPSGHALEDWKSYLDIMLAPYVIDKYIVALEKHADGGDHVHAYIELDRKANIKSAARLDLSVGGKKLHGNYKVAKPGHKKYAMKDGNYITNMDVVEPGGYVALAREGKFLEAEEAFAVKHPKDYILHLSSVRKNLKQLGSVKPRTKKFGPWNRDLMEAVSGWTPSSQTLVLIGPTSIGKTQWSLTQGENCLLIRHIDMLKRWNPSYDCIVFDDMSFAHWPRESCIHLVDLEEEAQINVRYGVVCIPAGVKRIITTNSGFDDIFAPDPAGAIARRCHAAII